MINECFQTFEINNFLVSNKFEDQIENFYNNLITCILEQF